MTTFRLFRHYIRLPFLLLGFIEFVILLLAVYGATWIRFTGDLTEFEGLLPRAFVFAAVVMTSMVGVGLYQPGARGGTTALLLRLVVSLLGAALVLGLLYFFLPYLLSLGRAVLIIAVVIALVSITAIRMVFTQFVDQRAIKRRVLVLGAGRQAALIEELQNNPSSSFGFDIYGFARTRGDRPVVEASRTIEIDTSLWQFMQDHHLDEIVVAMDDRRKGFLVEELLDCRMSGIDVVDIITFFERETGTIRIDLVQPSWFVFADGFKLKGGDRFLHRGLDIAGSLVLLLLGTPFMLATVIAIKLEEGLKAPILYKQTRVGRYNREYELFKFRSMYVNAEAIGGARWAAEKDPRVTRTGGVIRKFRIDEIPQVFNVLRGEMSLVGPRPERPQFVQDFRRNIPYYDDRHRVRPGITGWAQLNYPYGSSVEDTIQKLQYDLYYIKNGSLFLDLLILLQTAEVILWGKGAR